jgi:hypothetical protein
MMKMNRIFGAIGFAILTCTSLVAGNPDRQGEAGAHELLINPWARTSGLGSLNTAMVKGVEAMMLNPAGLARGSRTEVSVGNTQYLVGSDIKLNSIGLAQKVGKNGAFGLSLVAVSFGKLKVTTTDQPAGTGATFSPSFFNLALSYAHSFENKVSVGLVVRSVNESTSDLSATGICFDAGVQYVSGEKDQLKLGIAIRNVGSRMRFGGEGLSKELDNPNSGTISYLLTYDQQSASFELPSLLNMGLSYDFLIGTKSRLTALSSFTANSFSRDELGLGLEFGYREIFLIRGAYKFDVKGDSGSSNIETGLSGGVTFDIPVSKESDTRLGVDYSYRQTRILGGTHNFGLRISI